MTPLTENPTVVVLIDPNTLAIRATATNVSSDINVIVTTVRENFDEAALGRSFNSINQVATS